MHQYRNNNNGRQFRGFQKLSQYRTIGCRKQNVPVSLWLYVQKTDLTYTNCCTKQRIVPAFSTSCFGLINQWKKLISPQGSREIDVAPEFQNLAGDVIARTAFGSSYEDGKRIFELQQEQTKLVLESFHNIYIPGFRCILIIDLILSL